MSLINKMLQDLDARGSQPGHALTQNVKSVPDRRALPLRAMGIGALLLVVVAAAGVFGWRYLKRPPAVAAAPAKPAAAPVQVAAAPVLPPPPVRAQPVPTPPVLVQKAPPVVHLAAPRVDAPAPRKPVKEKAEVKPVAAPVAEGRQMNEAQRAEAEYRKALAGLQEGRVHESIAGLERALQIEPRHDAARQMLVGLLIEARRNEEAIAQLQVGLALEPRQPGLAILLARLQIERGGSGIETLTRTLPYAVGNAEYHAFFAGALQRQQRHKEAAEQYQAALRANPQNGVWWMGLGMSLQAEKRPAEAIDAFKRAKESGTLKPELQDFVERKLQSLSH